MTKEELQKLVSSWENLWVVKVNGVDLTPSFPLLMEMALEGNDASGWRASWVADKIAWKNRALLAPYCHRIIDALPVLNHTGKKRQFLRMVTCCKVDPDVAGWLFDYCQGLLFDSGETVAIKAYAMQILYNLSEEQPGLKPEVSETIRQIMEISHEPGIQARCRNLLKRLAR